MTSAMAAGLTHEEAARRLATIGPNEVRRQGRISITSSIAAQLRDPLILVLLAACALTLATGDIADAAVIALVVVVNTSVGVAQEIKSDRAVTALERLSTPSVRVRRDGDELLLPAVELVPGDVVLLAEGDIVPADCQLLEAMSLLVDESALTGESVPVGKLADSGDEAGTTLLSGSVIAKGRATAVVTATGSSSAMGEIAELLDTRVRPTPLQRRLAGLGRVLAIAAVALSALVMVIGLARGEPLEVMLVTAISLAVAAVPESLPAVVTLSLALGSRRMVARHAIVRKLPSVETLGSVTVLATDKTGTLTQARMVVERIWTPERERLAWPDEAARADAVDVRALLEAGALCNDAHLGDPGGTEPSSGGLGDPTEVALLAAAAQAGIDALTLTSRRPRVDEIPFDSEAQAMTTIHELPTGYLVVSKGSVEALHGRHASDDSPTWRAVRSAAAELASEGYRVLAVSSGTTNARGDWSSVPQQVLGLFAISDPPKPNALSTVRACTDAGMTAVLITGDHPATARAIAARVGILTSEDHNDPSVVVTGADLESDSVADLTHARVFARTSPRQKLDIVQAWQTSGAVVAMTGDGVNDGPALRRADIGVAMGHRGTEVARQAADLVLADDDLATVVVAVEEGRRIYANIRRFLTFAMAGGVAEIVIMLLGPFVGLTLPLGAAQILWINLLTHGLTGVAMGAEPAEVGLMQRSPTPPAESVLGNGLWQRVMGIGTTIAVVALGLGLVARSSDRAWQTIIFLALTSLQLGVAMGLRPYVLTKQNLLLPVAVGGSLLLAIAGVYLPALQDLLGTESLPAADLAVALATGLVGFALGRLSVRTSNPRRAR